MQQRTVKRYGWKPSLPDPRDRKFKIYRPVPLPEEVDLRDECTPVYDQESLGSCTGNAIGGAYEFCLKKQEKPVFTPSRLYIYYNERWIAGTVDQDSGAYIRDGLKSLNKQGVCDELMWPYLIRKFKEKPSDECYEEGLKHTISDYERIDNRSLFLLKQCLAKGIPFIFGFSVFEGFESEEVARTGVVNMPTPGESMVGGHAVLAVGYDDKTKRFIVRNSWGEAWGQKGYFTIPFEYLTNPELADDFWAIWSV